MSTRPEAGRFGLKLEGAGKVRTFAIPNPIFQRLLKPLHDWEMSVLKSLRTDGTFDQLRPLRRLRGKKELYSFDLKDIPSCYEKRSYPLQRYPQTEEKREGRWEE
ncbi:UNVERIFIED_CONTAM: hypothetical protein Sindi_1735500 [Sesamum indicum]